MLRFRRMRTLQKFVAAHASVHNHFNVERHLYSRSNFKLNRAAALDEVSAPPDRLRVLKNRDWFAFV